ncbi:MAG: tyrosine-type recombinase/integrase [Prolixibacteraceae bacterium]|nr:tyrosine-type recombinase/integrase [Prolixibacteraceae bacterium]
MSKKNNECQVIEIARLTFDRINTYIPTLRTNSPHTVRAYRTAVNLYINYLEDKGITNKTFNAECFSVSCLNDYIIWLKQERNCCNKTCNNRLAAIKCLLKYIGIRNPTYKVFYMDAAISIKRLRERKSKVQGMTRDAVRAILDTPNPSSKVGLRDIAIMSFEYGTATRIDEVLSLKINSLKLSADMPYATILGKGNKIRTVYLMSGLVQILQKYMNMFHVAKPEPNEYLFYSSWHGQKSKLSQEAIRKRLKIYASKAHEICNDVPLDLHSHQWRHTKACHWLEDGINIVEISKLLGHENIETTMIYQDITTKQQMRALATLEDESTSAIPKKWKLEKNVGLSNLFRFTRTQGE